MNQSIELTHFITQALSPAVAMSATGLLVMGLHNRISVLGGRVRQLNRELTPDSPREHVENVHRQVEMFMQRARVFRNRLFLLYAALGSLVFTAFAIAMVELGILPKDWNLPVASFLLGLVLIFVATLLEAREVTLNLRTLKLDIEYAFRKDARQ